METIKLTYGGTDRFDRDLFHCNELNYTICDVNLDRFRKHGDQSGLSAKGSLANAYYGEPSHNISKYYNFTL